MSYSGPVIDVDVHHSYAKPEELLGYLPERWRSLLENSNLPMRPSGLTVAMGGTRLDASDSEGNLPGSSYQMLRTQILDPQRVERAVLGYGVGIEVYQYNHHLGAALATALNNWSVERWLSGLDDRLYGALIVSSTLPQEAAQEIRRVGANDRMVEVLITDGGVGVPFGHPIYDPIYEAAVEYGLPVAIHFGMNMWGGLPSLSGGGLPSNGVEFYSVLNQAGMHHVTSLITHGVFEKFPTLKVIMMETGFNWVPWVFSHLDFEFPRLRRETALVKKLPSEYLREHIRFSTQPFEHTKNPDHLIHWLDTLPGAEDLLLFATDWPHWDADEAGYVARRLPGAWLPKVFYENALHCLRWPAEARKERVAVVQQT